MSEELEARPENKDPLRAVIIGIGGVGTRIADELARLLNFHNPGSIMILVDGDSYEPKNEERQPFDRAGNKAEAKAGQLEMMWPNITVEAWDCYADPETLPRFMYDGDVVFLCADDHNCRRLVSRYAEGLDTVSIIAGGNDYINGSIQVMYRKDGKVVGPSYPSLEYNHPEIAEPKARARWELGCDDVIESVPQIGIINADVAVEMLKIFLATTIMGCRPPGFYQFDTLHYRAEAENRSPIDEEA